MPVVAEPGRGYSLVEGYFLPPLRFSADEAIMLLLGADVMAQSFDADYGAAAEGAARKIAGVLPVEMRAEVQSLRESIRFIAERPAAKQEVELLRLVRRAIVAALEATDTRLELGRALYQRALMRHRPDHSATILQDLTRARDLLAACSALRDLERAEALMHQ